MKLIKIRNILNTVRNLRTFNESKIINLKLKDLVLTLPTKKSKSLKRNVKSNDSSLLSFIKHCKKIKKI